jgi:hypothetical protein
METLWGEPAILCKGRGEKGMKVIRDCPPLASYFTFLKLTKTPPLPPSSSF